MQLAGREGFEPSDEVLSPVNRLAGGPIRPLWHLPECLRSVYHKISRNRDTQDNFQAEGEGFEPSVDLPTHSCFQDSRLSPLGHPSSAPALRRHCTIIHPNYRREAGRMFKTFKSMLY